MEDEREFKTAALLEVNHHILEVAAESIAGTAEETWEFFCECGGPDCHELVNLSVDGYIGLRLAGDYVLAGDHRLSRAEIARRHSRRLREEAQALKAQGEHQVRRARRARRPGPARPGPARTEH